MNNYMRNFTDSLAKDQAGNNFRFWANYGIESIGFEIIVKEVSAWKPLLHKSSG